MHISKIYKIVIQFNKYIIIYIKRNNVVILYKGYIIIIIIYFIHFTNINHAQHFK